MFLNKSLASHLILSSIFVFLILVTRISHELTSFSLPDASLIIFLACGIFLKDFRWLLFFLSLLITIDTYVVYSENMVYINFASSYIGHIFTYILSWEVGRRFLTNNRVSNLNLFIPITLLVIASSYVISYTTHYFLSGWIVHPKFLGNLIFLKANIINYFISNVTYAIILFVNIKLIMRLYSSSNSIKPKTH